MNESICGNTIRIAPDAHFGLRPHQSSADEKDTMRRWKEKKKKRKYIYIYKTVSTPGANNQFLDLDLKNPQHTLKLTTESTTSLLFPFFFLFHIRL